jgi:molybdate transport system permease protein
VTRVLGAVAIALVAAVALGFLVLPVVAIFARVSPGTLLDQLGSGVVKDALVVTLKTSAAAQALVLAFGTPLAWVLASRRFRGRGLLVTLVELPIVLPPAVAGIGLLAALGRTGLLHTSLPFTQGAVIAAVAFVAGPLYVRQAIAAFEGLDPNLLAASRTLGAGPGRTFFRVAASASSARRSCSPAASRASPRRCPSRSTRSSTAASTPRSRSAACSCSSASRSC